MPGAYAHITLVNQFRDTNRLDQIKGLSDSTKSALFDWFKFSELGAVSPDYPYLAVGNSNAAKWADLMHYTHTGEIVRAGVKHVRLLNGEPQRKCLAWLLGYSAHVVADVTIHPIVELKVGTYAENKKAHRICEMNQDAYIFPRLSLGDVGVSDYLESGIASCCDPADDDQLDQDVVALWKNLLKETHPGEFSSNPPNIAAWHKGFNIVVEAVSEAGDHLLPLARHLAADCGLTYPSFEEVDRQFIENLTTPLGHEHYDAIFDKAVTNIGALWAQISAGVFNSGTDYLGAIADWNLDTGRDSSHKLVYWG